LNKIEFKKGYVVDRNMPRKTGSSANKMTCPERIGSSIEYAIPATASNMFMVLIIEENEI